MKVPLSIPNPPRCPQSLNELFEHLRTGSAIVPDAFVNFGSAEPTEDGRALPWIRTDANRNPAGLYTYSANLGKWVRDWGQPVGAIVTVYRSAATVSADREDKGLLDGWELADGTGAINFNLTSQQAFFQGSAPNWDVYTLIFIGYPA